MCFKSQSRISFPVLIRAVKWLIRGKLSAGNAARKIPGNPDPFVQEVLVRDGMKLFSHRIGLRRPTGFARRTGMARMIGTVLLTMAAGRAAAAVHPVPLDKNTDPKKCLECHDDKAKHKFVHSAMQGGCMACHEIRVNKDITRVKLITATPTALCLTCHADKSAADIKGTVHPPAVRDCLKCHDAHSSDNK